MGNARRMVDLEGSHGSFRRYLRSHGGFERTVKDLRKQFKFLGDMDATTSYTSWEKTHLPMKSGVPPGAESIRQAVQRRDHHDPVASDVGRPLQRLLYRHRRLPARSAGGTAVRPDLRGKDIFDVAGHVTGGGNPDWKATRQAAIKTAWAVQVLVQAGATMVGKTITDELTRGIFGENPHYGTPINPRAPGRVPGGSSSGSASAVAAGW